MQLATICFSLYFPPGTNQSELTSCVTQGTSNRRMRLTSERSQAKMAAGSDLLDDVFLNTEVAEKVVSNLVGAPESQLSTLGCVNSPPKVQSAAHNE